MHNNCGNYKRDPAMKPEREGGFFKIYQFLVILGAFDPRLRFFRTFQKSYWFLCSSLPNGQARVRFKSHRLVESTRKLGSRRFQPGTYPRQVFPPLEKVPFGGFYGVFDDITAAMMGRDKKTKSAPKAPSALASKMEWFNFMSLFHYI